MSGDGGNTHLALIGSAARLVLLAACLIAGPAAAQMGQYHLILKRTSLTTGTATGEPAGGTFAYTTQIQSGTTIGTLTSPDNISNPNMMQLPDPANPSATGAPSPGGLGSYTATYTVNGVVVKNLRDDPFHIPTFGMSCYFIALEADYGSAAQNTCTSIRINGHVYQGTVTNPDGYPGTYCASFIAEVVLQGSAQLNNGTYIHYAGNNRIVAVPSVTGADGTALIAGGSVARDRSIIRARNKTVSADQVGDNLLANDTGGAIVGYRLDLYNGAGQAVCNGYANPMAIAACDPAEATCTGYAFP